jgi:hypothetical protein
MNLLEKWAKGTLLSDSQILEILQDWGVISDNCYKLSQVANDKQAVEFLIKKLGL